jgi:chorismate mutase/prephenate dehydratase
MAKQPKSRGGKDATPASLRKQLEKMDRELLHLLAERARGYERLVKARVAAGESPWDPQEEQAELQALAEHGAAPLRAQSLLAIFRELQSGCRALIQSVRVAYLGPEYSYSHLAARRRFGETVELVPVATISAVFEEVQRGQANFGIVPLENSTDGRIADTLEMFARLPIRICGEIPLRIHHHLLGRCPRERVVEVYSKPQALSQCRSWLAKHLMGARMVEMTSTARAAQIAAEKEGTAAIASLEAGQHYGLEVIASNIEDNQHNLTRFAVIGDAPPRRTKQDKTALMFQIPHRPGALADAMVVFKRNHLNLTWIESFPMPGATSEYVFFAEFEGHESEPRAKRAVAALGRKALRLNVLGSYMRVEPIE